MEDMNEEEKEIAGSDQGGRHGFCSNRRERKAEREKKTRNFEI